MKNPYLEKSASLLAGAAIAHLAQNALTNKTLSSRAVSKYLANSFSQGYHGVVDTSAKASILRGVAGALTPDIAVAHKAAHTAGGKLSRLLRNATARQKVGVRMITQGRFDDLLRHNLHKDPVVQTAHSYMSKALPLGGKVENLTPESATNLKKLWSDKSHPLLSNIASNITKGEVPVGENFKKGVLTQKAPILGSIGAAALEPAAGAMDLFKNVLGSDKVGATKAGRMLSEFGEKAFIKTPIQKGLSDSVKTSGVGFQAYKFGMNPVSAHLKRTTAALREAVGTTSQ